MGNAKQGIDETSATQRAKAALNGDAPKGHSCDGPATIEVRLHRAAGHEPRARCARVVSYLKEHHFGKSDEFKLECSATCEDDFRTGCSRGHVDEEIGASPSPSPSPNPLLAMT